MNIKKYRILLKFWLKLIKSYFYTIKLLTGVSIEENDIKKQDELKPFEGISQVMQPFIQTTY